MNVLLLRLQGTAFKTIEALENKTDEPHIIAPQLNAFRKLMANIE